ncbi:hypothetical protein FRB99_001041 [Tulasnella sp. 403]|nr:hypothetical protein FRB99_001041 [Tulasnella sp. 403]
MDESPSEPFAPRRPYFHHRATASKPGGKSTPTSTVSPEPIGPAVISPTLEGYQFTPPPKPGANARSSIASSRSSPLDSLQIEIPRQFGEAGGYWKHYDHLADRHDRDMVKVLSDNLDMFTLDMLSSPNDAQTVALLKLIILGRTNLTANDFEPPPFTPTSVAVRVNCFFGATTLGTQGRWRQRKLNGVARWHFQNVVETLPILLQIALVTLIAGIIDLLNSLNRVVTAIVTLFCAAGIVAYGVSVIVATLDPECPFQTPVSLFLHEAYIRCWDWGSDKWDRLGAAVRRKRNGMPSGFGLANIMPTAFPLAPRGAARDEIAGITTHTPSTELGKEHNEKREYREGPTDEKENNRIDTDTASWVIVTSEHKEALIVTAKNIPALRRIRGTHLGQGGMAYRYPATFVSITLDSFPQFFAALPIHLAGLMKPSTEKKRFRISASKLGCITLVQWLAHMSFANPDISSPTILNIGAWSLGKLPSMISGTDDGFTQELQDEWWHAYTLDKNLYKNVVQALNMYHYYQRLQSAPQPTKIQAQSDYSPFLRPEQYAELYTELLRAFMALIDSGAYHHETEGSQYENDERGPFDDLEDAIGQTMGWIRKDAIEAMFPRATDGDADLIQDGGSLAPTLTEEYLTSRLRNSPTLSDAVVKALKKEHEGSRYAALAMIHDYARKWFTDDKTDLHERFTQAGLVPTLRACMTNEENLPLVSGIIVQLMDSSLWAREVTRSQLLNTFLDHGRDVIQRFIDNQHRRRRGEEDTRGPCSPFRVLEYILDVWKRVTLTQTAKLLPKNGVSLKLDSALSDINTRNIDDESATDLNDAYTKLLRDANAAWWKLWAMPHPSTILRDRSGSLGISGSLDRT